MGVITARINKIKMQAPKASAAAPASSATAPQATLPPGGIGPQPPPGSSPALAPALAPPLGAPPVSLQALQLGMPAPPGYSIPGMPPLLGFPGFPGTLPPGPPGAAPQGGFLLPPLGPPPAPAP